MIFSYISTAGPHAPASHEPFLTPGAPPLWLVLDKPPGSWAEVRCCRLNR